jgi:hypothetical protein
MAERKGNDAFVFVCCLLNVVCSIVCSVKQILSTGFRSCDAPANEEVEGTEKKILFVPLTFLWL